MDTVPTILKIADSSLPTPMGRDGPLFGLAAQLERAAVGRAQTTTAVITQHLSLKGPSFLRTGGRGFFDAVRYAMKVTQSSVADRPRTATYGSSLQTLKPE